MTLTSAVKFAGAALLGGALLLIAGWDVATAQQPAPWSSDTPARPASQPKAGAKAQPKAAPKEREEAAPARGSDTQLRQRVEQLEEQLADMQVTMGTLESLGKTGGATSASQPVRTGGISSGGVDQARIDSLETQIRALAAQVEQLSTQMRQASRRGEAPALEPATSTAQRTEVARPAAGGFDTTVTTGADPIGRILEPSTPGGAAAQPAALPAAAQAAGSPKELYETAYGYLLQQDYGGAEVTFEEFLRRYPSDRQAADAQYWYGETLYVQRRYKPAAQSFLRVIDKHQASAKVPNSILKLAMTLEQLGQRDCALFSDLETRHPNAPADVKTKARALKQRVGC